MEVQIVNYSHHPLPAYATLGASGMDLRAFIHLPIRLAPRKRMLIPTGISIALPQGYEGQIRPRSGLALHHGMTVLNSPGTIDEDYRGEIKILLMNCGDEPFVVQDGDRIAQLVVAKYESIRWTVVPMLDQTDRGSGGHGSTGRN
ncbi:Deoxyuridine 5'-triphosphate nucleotidohydrolase [Cardinium endosymbiont cEper1 of Encarsia pergandiella]|uniref:dUTP diphosphatase n=1 Tax=Cardinium endosymbiont of Encarsia pergandiella TaxID=249402 RepID=UPI00027EA3BA|nr:dUTP diphosphatase [Cardinium endosymbiont of Encarsia pergandiella]CCM10261.1 Deoxyuridine 5'-triphosphate nucleotidohydrolase [Cardinium endosymbiont cEper1 of Encarsia pergandiella]